MKFQITRTTYSFDAEDPPHPKAVLEETTIEDYMYFPHDVTSQTIDTNWEHFQGDGFNHRREDRVLIRNKKAMCWMIEVNTLEELMQLGKDTDEPIIIFQETMKLEIYDGWRE